MNGFTGEYTPVGRVHPGEYIVPTPYDYPKWTKYVWPKWLRAKIRLKTRVYNPDKDVFRVLTGKRIFDERG